MGILDRSKSITQVEETQINAPVGVQGDDNLTAVALGGGDVYAVSTDHNAIGAATELAARSIEAGENLVSEAARLSLETSRGVIDASRDAQDLVAEIAGRSGADIRDLASDYGADVRSLAGSALSTSERLAAGAQEQSADVLTRALDFTRGLQTKFQETIGSTVDALQRIGVEQNKSTDQRLAETTDRTLKYALIALGVMATGLVVFAAMRR